MKTSNKYIKRIAMILVFALVLTAVPLLDAGTVFAAGEATISSAEGLSAEAGSTITVPVNISGSPGFAGLGLNVSYDQDVLTPQSVEASPLTSSGTYNDSIETSKDNTFKIVWASSDNLTGNGTLFNITFAVSEYALGYTNIEFSYIQEDTYDEDFADVSLTCIPATVHINARESTVTTIRSNANQEVNAGGQIGIPIIIDNVDKVSSLAFDIKYDAEVFCDLTASDGLGRVVMNDSAGTAHFDVSEIDTSATSGTLATLTFNVADYRSGNYVFELSSNNAAAEDFRIKVINTHADENPVVYGRSVELSGSDLAVDIGIRNNHGIAAYRITLKYDPAVLTPVSVTKNSAVAGSFENTIGAKDGSFDVIWFTSDNFTKNDTLFTANFIAVDGAQGNTTIGLSYNQNDTCDEEMNDVVLTMEDIDVQLSEEIPKPVPVTIRASKAKTDYHVGDTLNTDDITLIVTYDDESSAEVTDFTTNADTIDMSTAGRSSLVISYTENGVTMTAGIWISVTAELKSISTSKVRTAYNVGESLNVDDITVTAEYTDGSTREVNGYSTNAADIDMSAVGPKTLVITYTEDGITVNSTVILNVANSDQDAADSVTAVINSMDPEDEDSVNAARAAYDALTDAQKALVDPAIIAKLIEAEEALNPDSKTDINTLDFEEIYDREYNGDPYEPFYTSATYKSGNSSYVLYEGTDYIVGYKDNIDAGTASAIVTGIGDYKGTRTFEYQITPCDMTAYKGAIKFSAAAYTYDGKVKTPKITENLDYFEFEAPFPANDEYTAAYSGNRKSIGTHKVTYNFKGNYKGSLTYSFKINPKGTTISKLIKGKKMMTVKWKIQASKMPKARISGYQIRYSLKSNMSGAKTKMVKGYKKTSLKIKKLKAKKKYYVQIRTFIKVGKSTYYSTWSKAKPVKIK